MNTRVTGQASQAADFLNAIAPAGERLAYVNPQEEMMMLWAGGSGMPHAGGIPTYGNFFQGLIDKFVPGRAAKVAHKEAVRAQKANQAQQQAQMDASNRASLATAFMGAGAPIFDVADTERTDAFFAQPGDANYEEDFSMGGESMGKYMFPLRDAEKEFTGAANELAETFAGQGKFSGSRLGEDREASQPYFDAQDSARDTLSYMYSDDFDRDMGGFVDERNRLLGDMSDTLGGVIGEKSGRIDDLYAQELENARLAQTGLQRALAGANRQIGENYGLGNSSMADSARVRAGADAALEAAELQTAAGLNRAKRRYTDLPYESEIALQQADLANQQIDNREGLANLLLDQRLSNVNMIPDLMKQGLRLDADTADGILSSLAQAQIAASPFARGSVNLPAPERARTTYTPVPNYQSNTGQEIWDLLNRAREWANT